MVVIFWAHFWYNYLNNTLLYAHREHWLLVGVKDGSSWLAPGEEVETLLKTDSLSFISSWSSSFLCNLSLSISFMHCSTSILGALGSLFCVLFDDLCRVLLGLLLMSDSKSWVSCNESTLVELFCKNIAFQHISIWTSIKLNFLCQKPKNLWWFWQIVFMPFFFIKKNFYS